MAKSDVLVRMKADTQNYDANIAKARRSLDQFKKDKKKYDLRYNLHTSNARNE